MTGRPSAGWTAVVGLLVVVALAVGAPAAGGSVHEDLSCEYPVTVTDATGTEVTIEEEPERIVTLAPSAAQTLWEIGARGKVVGMSMHAGFLEGAETRTNVSADPLSTDLETVVDLEPDLVIAPNVTPRREVTDLRELGLTVVHVETATSVDDVVEKTALMGQLVGACAGAAEAVDDMERTLARIASNVPEAAQRPIVYYSLGDGFTPGAGTFQSDAIERAGLRNLAAEEGIDGWAQLSEEVVVEADPAWIAYPDSFPAPPVSDALGEVTAVREDQLVALDANAISQPSPRLIDAMVTLHEAVYGELPTPTATPTPTASPTATPTSTDTRTAAASPTPTDDSDAIPGFGPSLAALAGLLTVALIASRRRE